MGERWRAAAWVAGQGLSAAVDDAGQVIGVTGPKALASSLRALRRASRRLSRRRRGSASRGKAAARLARVHAKVANVRADALHQATSGLAREYETVVVEDLNVTGMLASRRLARAVAGQGFGTARRMLGYKAAWRGGHLITADRWYPSSKTCSRCGWRKPSLTLAERTFSCQACGLVTDRDVNAAINLLNLASGTASGAGTGPGGVWDTNVGDWPVTWPCLAGLVVRMLPDGGQAAGVRTRSGSSRRWIIREAAASL